MRFYWTAGMGIVSWVEIFIGYRGEKRESAG
jgi:hypothetical protein